MTSEKTRKMVTSLMQEAVALAMEAGQISSSAPREARDLARMALNKLQVASSHSSELEHYTEKRITGVVTGQVALFLKEQFDL